MTVTQAHALYRFFDSEGVLLYVGITLDPGARWKSHSKDKPWWLEVASVTVEQWPSREMVLQAERAAIISEHPKHNVIYNNGNQVSARPLDVLERMTEWPGWGAEADDMPDDCHDDCVKAGFANIYYPYRWHGGLGHYRCARGHNWTCHWGHKSSGEVLENFGKRQSDEIDLRAIEASWGFDQ
jgi:hypothetical protein